MCVLAQALLADPDMNAEEMNWHDDLGWTPLTYAAFYGDYDLVKQASLQTVLTSRVLMSAGSQTIM